MSLVRKLVLVLLQKNVLLKALHLSSAENNISDTSRNFQRFKELALLADADPELIPDHLWKI